MKLDRYWSTTYLKHVLTFLSEGGPLSQSGARSQSTIETSFAMSIEEVGICLEVFTKVGADFEAEGSQLDTSVGVQHSRQLNA